MLDPELEAELRRKRAPHAAERWPGRRRRVRKTHGTVADDQRLSLLVRNDQERLFQEFLEHAVHRVALAIVASADIARL